MSFLKAKKTFAAIAAVVLALPGTPVLAAERIPDDPYFPEQWYLRRLGVTEAWNRTLGFEGVTIAIIDSGVDVDHPDLKDNVWRNANEIPGDKIDNDNNGYVDDAYGWDFVDNDNDPRPNIDGEFSVLGANHGTIGAGIAAARGDNGKGIVGVTWQATIMPLRVLDSNGVGESDRISRAVEYATRNGAKVINLSFAGPVYSPDLALALRRAYDAGVFIVAAAGNAASGSDASDLDARPLYPICSDLGSSENFIYGVAATDEDDRRATFSNYGAGCVDGSVPGVRVVSTQLYRPDRPPFDVPYGGYYNGTSAAVPMVSGIVALLRSLDRNLTPKQITNILTETAVRIDDKNPEFYGKLGRGRIDVAKAVERIVVGNKEIATPASTASFLTPGDAGRIVLAAAGPGRKPEIRLFTSSGLFIRGFEAFPIGYRGGVSVAVGNFDGSGRRSIVAGALGGGSPQVRIFDINTRPIGSFYAYDIGFRGGVRVAAGDLDGDKRDELVTGAGPGGGPHVRMFSASGREIGGFFAFDKSYRGGIEVAAADFTGDGRAEIAVLGDGGRVRLFDGRGKLLSSFAAWDKPYSGASLLEAADADGDGRPEIAVSRIEKGKMLVTMFRGDGVRIGTYDPDTTFSSASPSAAGQNVSPRLPYAGNLAGRTPIVTATSGKAAAAALRFPAFESSFRGGVRVAATD